MKELFAIILLIGITQFAVAQQEPQFTQFLNYKMGLNPAHAGSEDSPVVTALIRSQWLGLDGSPQTQLLAFEMPVFNKKVGFGAAIKRRTIGLQERYTAEANYVYRFNFGRGKLGIGIQTSIRSLGFDFTEAAGTQPVESDPTIPVGVRTKYLPNFGAGLFYNSARLYLGVSVPRILKNEIDIGESSQEISREIQHVYIMAGGTFDLSDNLGLQPNVLLKIVNDSPFDADANLSLVYNDRYKAGFSYRLGGSSQNGIGESVALVVSGIFAEQIELGLSYDYTLSQIKNYASGSIEAMIKYYIGGRSDRGRVINPLPGSDYYK